MSLRTATARVVTDLRMGRHREAYTAFTVGLVLTVLGAFGFASQAVMVSGVLLGVTFLVFATTIEREGAFSALEQVLQNRDKLPTFSAALPVGGELWVYGPTAVNILVNAADIRRRVLDRGGQVRVIVQDPDSTGVSFTKAQLDDNLDFDRVLASSIATLRRMREWGACEYRLLSFSPGFSMVVVNPRLPDGFIILELHGFADRSIVDRMHIRISRVESLHWFDYWTGRFEAMWQQSREEDVPRPQVHKERE